MKHSASRNKSKTFIPDKLFHFPLAYLILFLVIFVIYSPALLFSLGKLDETNLILDHLAFLSDFHNLKEAVLYNPYFHKGGDFYRPMQNLSFMVDAHLSGQNGWGWYLTNILVHGFTCSLLYYLLNLFGKDRTTAFLLTLIYSVHPLFVQTVSWIPARGDLLLAMFSLASFIAFVRFIRLGKITDLIITILAFGLALFSKETAIVIPVVCIIYYFFLEKEKKISLSRLSVPFAGFILLFLIFMYLRTVYVRIEIQDGQFGILPFIVHLRTIPELIFKFFLPAGLGPMPAYNLVFTITGLLIFTGLIVVAIRFMKESGFIYFFGIAWFLLFLFPTLVFVTEFGSAAFDYMEHRAYLPLIGILLIVFVFLTSDLSPRYKKYSTVILFGILLISGIYSRIYSRNYRTPDSYYTLAVAANPCSAIAWYNKAVTRMNFEKDYRGAITDYDRSLLLYPDYAESYINRGYCREQLKDNPGAIADYEMAAKLKPGWYEPHVNLAAINRNLGLLREAILEYDTALMMFPGFYQGYTERGTLLTELQEYRQALDDFNKAISQNENYPEAYFNRGLLEFRLQELSSAMEDFSRALQLNPEYVEAWVNRGVLKYRLQDFQGSAGDFSEALAIDDKYAEAYLDRGMSRFMMNDLKGACEDWETAKSLQIPDAQALLDQYCRN